MAGRRSNGEGSISYDSRRKRYRAKVTIGWELNPETGRSKQIVKTLGSNYKTKGEAASALSEYLKTPFNIDNKNITFSELYYIWFDDWIVDHESHRYRAKAAYKYCSSLYEKKIRDITIIDMKHCINNGSIIETRGKYKGELKTASPSTKESMKYLFNHMFSYAVEARIVDRNFAKEFSLDKKVAIEKEQNHKDKSPFTENEMDTLWRSIEFVPFADMIIYACYSGWRPSELVKIKIENNKKLTTFDILDLIFIPFLNTTKNSEEIVKEICGYVSKITKITTKQTKILTWGLWLTTEIFIKNPETLEKVRTMSILKGESINEKLHNREIELRQEGIQEEKTEGGKKVI